MKTLIERFSEQLDSEELDEFLQVLEESEKGKTFIDHVEPLDIPEDAKAMIAGVFMTNAYLLAKVSELKDDITYLKSQTHNLM